MTEPSGPAIGAVQARQAALASRHSAVADVDRVLMDMLAGAHAEMRESVSRLNEIEAEIERAVSDLAGCAVDTPMGARELQRFLVAKQREIAAIVAHARELAQAKSAVLDGLRERYLAAAQA